MGLNLQSLNLKNGLVVSALLMRHWFILRKLRNDRAKQCLNKTETTQDPIIHVRSGNYLASPGSLEQARSNDYNFLKYFDS